jgi:hypothetical protein
MNGRYEDEWRMLPVGLLVHEDVAVPPGLQKRLMFLRTINVVHVLRNKCALHVAMSEMKSNVIW